MIVLKNLLNNYCSFDKYIIHYYFTLNLHKIDKFNSWNFTPQCFEELHGDDVYHSRYVLA